MEIVLLWLDDIDDLVISLMMTWERLRHRSLQIGFAAALALPAMTLSSAWTPLIPAVVVVASACVCFWGGGLFGAQLLNPRYEYSISRPSNA